MKLKTNRVIGIGLIVAMLSGSLLLGSCFLFKGTSAEDDVAKLQQEISDLTKQLSAETNPATKAQLKKDLAAMKENLEKALKRLVEEGKNIDVKGFLDQLGDSVKELGDK